MPSKMVVQRLRSSRVVVEAARVHGSAIAADIQARLPEGDAGAAGVEALTGSLATMLEAAAARMGEADTAHERELADDAAPRSERDEANEALVQALVELRGAVEQTYGDAAARRLGFDGPTPRDATTAVALVAGVLEGLGELSELTPRVVGLTLDPTALADAITESRDRLQAALQQVATEAREAEQTFVAKQAAMTEYDATFGAVATTLEGLFSLAGAPELARRVRPSRRRPGQVDKQPEPDEGEGEGTGAPPS